MITDKDREAFEEWAKENHISAERSPAYPEMYLFNDTRKAFEAWQAAKAHYAPPLTFEQAIEKAGDAVEKLVSRGCFPGDSEFDYALEMSAAALRAAAVRFKEEA